MRTFPASAPAFPVLLNRNAFGPRLVARAGDVWRAMQDVVVDQSSSVGWTPERYVSANLMFIVRHMVVRHHREVRFAESLEGRTWPSRSRREMLFTREVRLLNGEELVATGTQEWVLLTRALEPTRGGTDITSAFALEPGFPSVELPQYEHRSSTRVHRFAFHTWHVWMDAHAHVNHPAYVDYCDEGLSRALAAQGIDPLGLSPLAEEVHFRAAIGPDVPVVVETVLKGAAGEVGVFGHRILTDGKVCATATTLRHLVGADPSWTEGL
jgi:acyl-CoA thioesterase FadM